MGYDYCLRIRNPRDMPISGNPQPGRYTGHRHISQPIQPPYPCPGIVPTYRRHTVAAAQKQASAQRHVQSQYILVQCVTCICPFQPRHWCRQQSPTHGSRTMLRGHCTTYPTKAYILHNMVGHPILMDACRGLADWLLYKPRAQASPKH